jgi:hypothetical protein
VTGHGSSRLTRGGSLKRDAPGVAGQGGEVRGHHRSEAHQRVATGDREMGRGALATSTGACGDHGTGVHASPAVRGAREGPIRVGVWRGRRCRAWLREGRRDGVGRKLELELESAMAARRLCSAQNEEESEQRQGRTLGSWRGEPRALASATVGIGAQPRGKEEDARQQGEVHGGHVRDTCRLGGLSPNRWRAQFEASWRPFLGWIWAELDLGPKMKFEDHMMLYDFY